MKHKPIEIPPNLAAKYDHPEQFAEFDRLTRHMLSEKPEPTHVVKPRGRPKKIKDPSSHPAT